MAKSSMTKAELDAYFADVLSKFKDSPIAEYFGEDVKAILESAERGSKKNLKVDEKRAIYNETVLLVNSLVAKVDGYLRELKANLQKEGASSNLQGTFYYRSTSGDAAAGDILETVDKALNTDNIEEKGKLFNKTIDLFTDYVDNSELVTSLDANDTINTERNNASLSRVYKNALEVEKMLRYRTEGSEIYKLLDTPTNETLRKDVAAPFKYYTILAGIKTGKIKKLTPAQINDLQWVYKNNPSLLPKNSPIDDKTLKESEEKQNKLFEMLRDQHDEQTIREELIKHKHAITNDHKILAACLDNTRAFKVGQNNFKRNLVRAGIALAGAGVFVGTYLFTGILEGMPDPTAEKVMNQLFTDGRIWNTLLPFMGATAADLVVNGSTVLFRNKPFIKRFNEIDRPALVKYLAKNKAKWNEKDKKQRRENRKEMIKYVNEHFDNVLGDGIDAERNLDILMRGLQEQEKVATRMEKRSTSKKKGEGVTLSNIAGKNDIEDFAKNIGLSEDNPFSQVMTKVLDRLGVKPDRSRAAAFASAPPEAEVNNSEPTSEEDLSHTDETAKPSVEEDLDKALTTIRSNINEERISLDVAIGGTLYEIEVKTTGKVKDIGLTKKSLDTALGKVRTQLSRGVNAYETSAKAPAGTIPIIKKPVGGGKVHISVKKKEPPTTPPKR